MNVRRVNAYVIGNLMVPEMVTYLDFKDSIDVMKLVGLTGGIGSGKSTVARMLLQQGIPIVDADEVSREVVQSGQPALRELAEAFGNEIINEQGELNRAELARRAFSSKSGTETLNSITHPHIRNRAIQKFEDLVAQGNTAAVYDMPLLIEQGLHEQMDLTVVVEVDAEERVRRLVATRGLDEQDARNRIARQVDDVTRRGVADVIIDNNGTVEDLEPQVKALADKIGKL